MIAAVGHSRTASVLFFLLLAGCKATPTAGVTDGGPRRVEVMSKLASARPVPDKPTVTLAALRASSSAQMTAALALASVTSPDCARALETMGAALYVAPPEVTDETRRAITAIGVCQRKKELWRDLEQIAALLGDDDPASPTAELLPRAKIGVGEYVTANTALTALIKQWPKDGELYATGALAACRLDDWDECGRRAEQALLLQRKISPGNTDDVSLEARLLRAQAYFFSGEIEQSTRELDALAKVRSSPAIAVLQARNQATKARRLWIETDTIQSLFLGILPLYSKNVAPLGPMATFKIYNFANHPFTLKVAADVPGICDPVERTLAVTAKWDSIKLTPTPRLGVDLRTLPREAKLTYKIEDAKSGTVYFEDTRALSVVPPTSLPLMVPAREGDLRKTRELSAAWVTPASRGVTSFLDAAKKRVPGGAFAGPAQATFAQVQAIWDEMRAREFSFTREPGLGGPNGVAETLLPADVIAATGGTYLEGVLLFASLLEAIGLDPILVFLPGHAMIGWIPSRDDRAGDHTPTIVSSPAGDGFFLDVTSVHSQPMEAAMLFGAAELVERTGGTTFTDGRAAAYLLSKLRAKGIAPRP